MLYKDAVLVFRQDIYKHSGTVTLHKNISDLI